jgi:hypothetical protein
MRFDAEEGVQRGPARIDVIRRYERSTRCKGAVTARLVIERGTKNLREAPASGGSQVVLTTWGPDLPTYLRSRSAGPRAPCRPLWASEARSQCTTFAAFSFIAAALSADPALIDAGTASVEAVTTLDQSGHRSQPHSRTRTRSISDRLHC